MSLIKFPCITGKNILTTLLLNNIVKCYDEISYGCVYTYLLYLAHRKQLASIAGIQLTQKLIAIKLFVH